MKTIKTFFSRLFILSVLTTVSVACSSNNEDDKKPGRDVSEINIIQGENLIPADAEQVGKINLVGLLDNAGIKISDSGAVTFDQELKPSENRVVLDAVKSIIQDLNQIDLTEIVAYKYNGNFFVLSKLRNEEEGLKTLAKLAGTKPSKNGEYSTFKINQFTLAVKDQIMWFTDGTLDDLIKANKDAARNSFAKYKGASDMLYGDWDIVLANKGIGVDFVNNFELFSDKLPVTGIKFNQNTLYTKSVIFNADGSRVNFYDKLGVIDTSFLSYMPSENNLVMALGPVTDPEIADLLAEVGSGIIEEPGTLALSMNLPETLINSLFKGSKPDIKLSMLDLLVYLQTPTDNFRQLANSPEGREMFQKTSSGSYLVDFDDIKFYVSDKPGDALLVSQNDIKPTSGNKALAQYFENQRGALHFSSPLPVVSTTLHKDYSIESDAYVKEDYIESRTVLNDGTGMPKILLTALRYMIASAGFRF